MRLPLALPIAAIVGMSSAGCVPMMAASAVSMAAETARGAPVSNAALGPQARDACTAQAKRYGAVHVIDVEQRRIDRIIVWGTVDDGKQKRSFQCDFGTKVDRFTLRPITASR
ncbi:MAG TPA: hypothetical protein VM308_08685 [Sphingomicrobium sp.]|nr:hypothetical protein [Sphingomicrobium sp.]